MNTENTKLPAKSLTKSDVKKAFWRWTFASHSNYNYERLQSTGFAYAMVPVLKRLYADNPEELQKGLTRHLEFFNTEPHFGGIIHGMTISLEEQMANGSPIKGENINALKTGLMGPLAGVGDTLWQGTIVPIFLSFAISLSSTNGSLLGPIFYIIAMFITMLSIAYILWMKGYYLGKEGVQKLLAGHALKKVMMTAQILGAIVIGGLTVAYVSLSTPLSFSAGESVLHVQGDVLDKLFKGLLPIAITLLSLHFLNKKMKSTTVLLILVLISGIGAAIGIF